MQLIFEEKASIPVESADSFVEFEQEGKQVWMHKDLAETKKESYRNQGQLTKLTQEFEGFKGKITESQRAIEEKAKLDREQALKEQKEKLQAEGKHSELHAMELELERNAKASVEAELEDSRVKYQELRQSLVDAKESDLASKISAKFTTPEFTEAVAQLLKMNRIKSVDDKVSFTNSSGEAVGTDIDSIVQMLQDDPLLKPFKKAPNSKPGVGANGGQQGASGAFDLNKPFGDMNTKEKTEYIKRKHAKGN